MPWKVSAAAFVLVFLAETPGRSTFATLRAASRTGAWGAFFEACAAFSLYAAGAAAVGAPAAILPGLWVRLAAGALFLGLAAVLWKRGDRMEALPVGGGVGGVFAAVLKSQWGDPGPLAAAAFAALYSPLSAAAVASLAFIAAAGLACLLGARPEARFSAAALRRLAAAAFVLQSAAFLARRWR